MSGITSDKGIDKNIGKGIDKNIGKNINKKEYESMIRYICNPKYSQVLNEDIQYQIAGIIHQLEIESPGTKFLIRNVTTDTVSVNMQKVLDSEQYCIVEEIYKIIKARIDTLNTPRIL